MTAEPASTHRRRARTRCKIKAIAEHEGRRSPATVLDLSPDGFSLYLRADIGADVGATVAVETDAMGVVRGTVRWVREPRLGLEFRPSSNTAAKVDSYLKTRD